MGEVGRHLDVRGMEALLQHIGIDAAVAQPAAKWLIKQKINEESLLDLRFWDDDDKEDFKKIVKAGGIARINRFIEKKDNTPAFVYTATTSTTPARLAAQPTLQHSIELPEVPSTRFERSSSFSSPTTTPSQVVTTNIVILGAMDVGKTSLSSRYISGNFVKTLSTIGCEFRSKKLYGKTTTLKLNIWDTSGQEKFDALTPSYYRKAQVAIVCFDLTNQHSIPKAIEWGTTLQDQVPNIDIYLVGTKLDAVESTKKVPEKIINTLIDSVPNSKGYFEKY
jgi:small GTP-binding protein